MGKSFDEKIKVENLACEVLYGIMNSCYYPPYLTEHHKQNSEYHEEFEKEFIKGLNYEQRKDYNSLISIRNAVTSTELDYRLLCGMKIRDAIDEIIKNPLKILNLYDNDGTPAREMYKSIKQKMEEKDN